MQKLLACLAIVAGANVCLAETARPDVPALSRWSVPAGGGPLSPGYWGLVAVDLANPSDAPAEVIVSTFFAGQEDLQYAKRWWLPAHSSIASWQPVFMPDTLSSESNATTKTLLINRTRGHDEIISSPTGEVLHDARVLIATKANFTALLSDFDARPMEEQAAAEGAGTDPEDFVWLARAAAGYDPNFVQFRDPFLPEAPEHFGPLAHLVIANDRLAQDAVGRSTIRRWLFGGGRAWIMLDRVSLQTVELLLGDECKLALIDRVGLTEVQVKNSGHPNRRVDEPPIQLEQPVDLVRVVADGLDTSDTVSGWPAACWQDFGQGKILFTTLGVRGWAWPLVSTTWVGPSGASGPRRSGGPGVSHGLYQSKALAALAGEFFGSPPLAGLDPATFKPFLNQQIGYRTLHRGTVLAVLSSYCIGLIVAGGWLVRVNRPAALAVAGPALAIVAAGLLAYWSSTGRHAVPATVAVAQLAEVGPGTEEIQLSGLLAAYHSTSGTYDLAATRGGWVQPDLSGLEGQTRRIVWTDIGRWHWEGLEWPAGVRFGQFRHSHRNAESAGQAIEARGVLGPDGLTGRVFPGPLTYLTDAVISIPSHKNLAVQLSADGAFSAGPDSVLSAGKFFAESLISDEQRRRQEVYRQLLPQGRPARYQRPTLLAWTAPLDMGFTFPQDMVRVGSTLVAMPLVLDRTPPDTSVAIPAPLLPFVPVPGPDGGISSPYDPGRGEWQERQGEAVSWLRFQVPAEVLPVEFQKVVLSVQITGPARKLEIKANRDGTDVLLRSVQDPIGQLHFELQPDELPPLDERGGLVLAVIAGERLRGAAANQEGGQPYWRIESLALAGQGRTRPLAPGAP